MKIAYKFRAPFLSFSGRRSRNDRAREIVDKGALYFANPVNFNDPFETFSKYGEAEENTRSNFMKLYNFFMSILPVTPLDIASSQLLLWFINGCANNKNHIINASYKYQSTYAETARGVAVCCLNSELDSVLSWSHYANEHKGLAFGFDVDNMFSGYYCKINGVDCYRDRNPLNVNYVYDKVECYLHELAQKQYYMMKFAAKSHHWAYEKEIRYIALEEVVYLNFNEIVEILIQPILKLLDGESDDEVYDYIKNLLKKDVISISTEIDVLYKSFNSGQGSPYEDRYPFGAVLSRIFKRVHCVGSKLSGNVEFNKSSLVEVVFGCKVSKEDIDSYINYFYSKNYKLKYYQMVMSSNGFGLMKKSIN